MSDTVRVALDIHTVVEVVDQGYLGLKSSVEEHIAKAVKDASVWQFLVKQGATEPQPLKVAITVRSVNIIPDNSETRRQ